MCPAWVVKVLGSACCIERLNLEDPISRVLLPIFPDVHLSDPETREFGDCHLRKTCFSGKGLQQRRAR